MSFCPALFSFILFAGHVVHTVPRAPPTRARRVARHDTAKLNNNIGDYCDDQKRWDVTDCFRLDKNKKQKQTRQAPAGVFQPDGPESLRVLVTPPLLLLQGMLSSLPANTLLAERAASLLARHARLVRHVLLFKESSLDALDAMSAVLAVLAHVSKPPFQVTFSCAVLCCAVCVQ